jgi:hypothetical protein
LTRKIRISRAGCGAPALQSRSISQRACTVAARIGTRATSALGSARETLSCFEVAAVFGYVHEDTQLNDQLNRVVGTLVRLVRV